MEFNTELLEKAKEAKSAEEILSLAKENGVELTEGFKRSNGHNKSKLQSKQPIQCKTDKYSSNKQ